MFKTLKHSFLLALLCSFALLSLLACGGDNTAGPGPTPKPNPEPTPTPEPVPNHASGDLVIELPGGVKMAFMWIEPGTFMMGTPDSVQMNYIEYERPQHQVTIPQGFYIGKYEVTQLQWQQVMQTAPWTGAADSIGPDFPAVQIRWRQTQEFFEKLNALIDGTFRLPTEAEWEYACRAGTSTRWSFGDQESLLQNYGWYEVNSENHLNRVGLKEPNLWQLYDMHGNVLEWTNDRWSSYAGVGPIPTPVYQLSHIMRGGYYASSSASARCANRGPGVIVGGTTKYNGFRAVREGPRISRQ